MHRFFLTTRCKEVEYPGMAPAANKVLLVAEVLKCTSIQPADLHEKFSPEMSNVLINLMGKMFQKFVHLVAFMLHDFFSNV